MNKDKKRHYSKLIVNFLGMVFLIKNIILKKDFLYFQN